MLRLNDTFDSVDKGSDLAQDCVKNGERKIGKLLSSRTVLPLDNTSGTVFVSGPFGRPIFVTVDDVRLAIVDGELALHISKTNDRLHKAKRKAADDLPKADAAVDLSVPLKDSSSFDHIEEAVIAPVVPVSNLSNSVEVIWPVDD